MSRKAIIILIMLSFLSSCASPSSFISAPALTPANPTATTLPATSTAIPIETPMYTATPVSEPIQTATPEYILETPSLFPSPSPIPTLYMGQALTLSKIDMIDEKNGWGMESSGHIVHTEDGGMTWQDVNPPEERYILGYVQDAQRAWAVPKWTLLVDNNGARKGYPSIHLLYTQDGGKSWKSSDEISLIRKLQYYPSSYTVDVQFINQTTGWLLVEVDLESHMSIGWQIFQTRDGGKSWTRLTDSENLPFVAKRISSIIFLDEKTGWSAGSSLGWSGPYKTWNASLNQTTDGGITWKKIPIPQPEKLPGVFQGNEFDCGSEKVSYITSQAIGVVTRCMVFGESTKYIYFYHITVDAGKTWKAWQVDVFDMPVYSTIIYFLNESIGWQFARNPVGGYILEHTNDGGATWNILRNLTWYGEMDFITEDTGWAVASNGVEVLLVNTIDGGKTWQELNPVMK